MMVMIGHLDQGNGKSIQYNIVFALLAIIFASYEVSKSKHHSNPENVQYSLLSMRQASADDRSKM